jgi:hypothetical protein
MNVNCTGLSKNGVLGLSADPNSWNGAPDYLAYLYDQGIIA